MNGVRLVGGTVLTPGGAVRADVRIRDGLVVDVVPGLGDDGGGSGAPADERLIDVAGLLVGPGLVDLHTHLREPGHEWKEDIASGSSAAAAGGFTAVVAMPNTNPPTDTGHLARYIADRGRQVGLVDVVPAGCITAGQEGRRLAHLDELFAAGVRVFTDDGHTVADAGLLRRAMEYLESRGGLIAQHAEDPGLSRGGHMHEGKVSSLLGMLGLPALAETVVVARDLALAELTGARYHVQHVSCARTVELIHAAKQRGVAVTAEVTPHHLWFTDERVMSMHPVFRMYPPLRTRSDIEVLIEGLRDGVIDAVATDHAPHAAHEKDVPFEDAPNGVTGLETAFSAVRSVLDCDPRKLFRRLSVAPAAIAGLDRHGRWIEPGIPANLVVVDWDAVWRPGHFRSKSSNSPFAGVQLTGKVCYTFHDGLLSYDAGASLDCSTGDAASAIPAGGIQ
ncbi:MAG: dihydroorotase [bacterium]|nr:dihydroorotase [bacterium]MDE0288395.1 dihydroorotase [bacterium]MDE0438723.1 dihydroorotase [bacterium]